MPRNLIIAILDDGNPDIFDKLGLLKSWSSDNSYEAVYFPNAYTPYSLCTPSRLTMQTGRFASRHGCTEHGDADSTTAGCARVGYLNNRQHLIFNRMRRKGYDVGLFGKPWNRFPFTLGDSLSPPGVTKIVVSLDDATAYPLGDAVHGLHTGPEYYGYTVNNGTGSYARNGTGTSDDSGDTWTGVGTDTAHRQSGTTNYQDFFALRSRRWLEDIAGKRPFVCYFATKAPHRTLNPPIRHDASTTSVFGSVPISVATRPPYFNENGDEWQYRPGYLRHGTATGAPFSGSLENAYDAEQVAAWRQVQGFDEWAYDVKAILTAAGEWDNTDWLITNDNGFVNGDHRVHGKGVPYLGSLNCPLIFRHPGLGASRVDDALVSLADLCPTADEVTGGPATFQRSFDGMSLLRRAQDGAANWRTQTYHEYVENIEASVPSYRGGVFDLGGERFLYTELAAYGSDVAEREMYSLDVGEGYNLANPAAPGASAYATALAECATRLAVIGAAA